MKERLALSVQCAYRTLRALRRTWAPSAGCWQASQDMYGLHNGTELKRCATRSGARLASASG